MPSPITTSGFQIGVTPNVQFADPRLLAPRYQDILPAAQQGFGFANQIQAAPLQRQLQQIALQQEQAKLAQLPVEQQLMQIRLANASQPVASLEGISLASTPRSGDTGLQIMVDENDQPVYDANGQPRMEIAAGYTPKSDLMKIGRYKVFDPLSRTTSYEDRSTGVERTAEQIANDATMASYRSDLGDAAIIRANTAADKYESGSWKNVRGTVDDAGNLVLQQIDMKTGDLRSVPTGRKPSMSEMEMILSGMKPGAGSTVPAPSTVKPFTPPENDMSTEAIVARIDAALNGAPAANVAVPAANVPTLTVEQARIAPVNTIFIGIDGKKRKKNTDGTVSLIVE